MAENKLTVNELKVKGNECFKTSEFEKAVEYYQKAAELERSDNNSSEIIVTLLSNLAQAYLRLENYEKAKDAADESLQLDPTFKKSLLRRGIAHFELKNNDAAISDFRKMLLLEPKNSMAIDYLRRTCPTATIKSERFRRALIGHYFRRHLVKPATMHYGYGIQNVIYWIYFKDSMFRFSFISASFAQAMRFFWNTMFVVPDEEPPNQMINISIPFWHVIKRSNFELNHAYLIIPFNKPLIRAMLQAVKPNDAQLHFQANSNVSECFSFGKFKSIQYLTPFNFHECGPNSNEIKALKKYSHHITELPYHSIISKWKDVAFPNINTIRFYCLMESPVDAKFLKFWRDQTSWDIKRIIFGPTPVNLSTFENFNGAISSTVKELYTNFASTNDYFGDELIEQAKRNMATLKRNFPQLTEVTGEFMFIHPYQQLIDFTPRGLKNYIDRISTDINASFRPKWCERLRVLAMYISDEDPTRTSAQHKHHMKMMREVVESCRSLKRLKYIRGPFPSTDTFSFFPSRLCYAVIEFGTVNADFQITFKMNYSKHTPFPLPLNM